MDKISNITFGAIPIRKVQVQQLDKKTQKFLPKNAVFVMIDSKNKGDIAAINTISKGWKGAKFIQKIATAAHWMNDKDFSHIKVYALTTQTKNLKKLSPTKVLGLVEMRRDDSNLKNTIIQNLQVRPNAMYDVNNKKRLFRNTGTSILDSLKKIYKSMSLFSDDGVEPFYEKNGFLRDNYGIGHFVWYSNKLKMLMVRLRVFFEDLRIQKFRNNES